MTRPELIGFRDEIFVRIKDIGSKLVKGGVVDPTLPQQFTFLVMLHGCCTAQLKQEEEYDDLVEAVEAVNDVLDLVGNPGTGRILQGDDLTSIRLKLCDVLLYLET